MRLFFILLILLGCQSSFKSDLPALSEEDLDALMTKNVIEVKNPFTSSVTSPYPMIGQTEDGTYLYATKKALLFLEMEPYASEYSCETNMKIRPPSKDSPSYLIKKVGEIPLEGEPKIQLLRNQLHIEKLVLTLQPKPRVLGPMSEVPVHDAHFIYNLSAAALIEPLPLVNPAREETLFELTDLQSMKSDKEFSFTYLGALKKTLHVFRKRCDEQIFHYADNVIRSHHDDRVVVLTFEKEPLITIDVDKKTLEWNRWKVLVKKVGERSFVGVWNGDIQIKDDKVFFSHNRMDFVGEAQFPGEPAYVIECEELRR
jgi:hypothetical protein